MKVNLRDGRCHTCGGQLEIVDAGDATMSVECVQAECGDSYVVEPDAFGDGAMTYYPAAMTELGEDRDED